MIGFDRKIYFDVVRESLFDGELTQEQVDGQHVILAVAELQLNRKDITELRDVAYMLATTYHETAQRMWPIEEYGKGEGHDYGEPDLETGQTYYGRGFVQLTWRDNYARATDVLGLEGERDIEQHADRALDCLIATRVMFQGMRDGWFTGKKLADYFNETEDDPINARQIINGNDRDEEIAIYHEKFMEALNVSQIDSARAPPVPTVTLTLDASMPVEVELRAGANIRSA